jgi:hypothetical protein
MDEQALWYGYRMLEKTGGALKPEIKTSNVYEKKLLDEVRLEPGTMSLPCCPVHTYQ